MRIAFMSESDPGDIHHWSGTTHHLLKHCREAFDHVVPVQVTNFESIAGPIPERLRRIGEEATRALEGLAIDAVLCQGTSVIPHLETDRPIAFWHDSTWSALFRGHFPEVLTFAEFQARLPDHADWDRWALERVTVPIFCADWLVDVAVEDYAIPRGKLRMVPYGANLEGAPSAEAAERLVSNRPTDTCRLSFLGKDWRRKGLDKAVALAGRLNQAGLKTVLDVIGCDPEDRSLLEHPWVRHVGFLDKANPEHRMRLAQFLGAAHFLVHPAQFECFGVALAEANSFAVPVLGTPTTGLKTVVRDNLNGHLFPADTFAEAAAAYVLGLLAGEGGGGDYRRLAMSSYQEYNTRLNWRSATRRVREILEECV